MSTIIGLDGQPLPDNDPSSKAPRFAIVGSVNIHYAVFELQEGEDMADALRTQQLMAKERDPKLAEITRTERLFWAEDDDTRPTNRAMLCQQLIAFMTNLGQDGNKFVAHPIYTEEHMQRMIDHALAQADLKRESGDGPFPNPDEANGKKGL